MTLTPAQIDVLLTAGSAAPSGGNTQPWSVTVRGNAIELRVDPARGSPILDPCADASIMALGSFAENVAVAASAMGLQTRVGVGDTGTGQGALVHIQLQPDAGVRPDDLCGAVATRCTNRRAHVGPPIPDALVERLHAACRCTAGHRLLAVSSDGDKRAVARILAQADRVRLHNRALHREMFAELRWRPAAASRTGDGIDVRSLELPMPGRLILRAAHSRFAARYLIPGAAIESLSRRLLVHSSHLCALVMREPLSATSWVEAGRTLQRVWLTAEHYQAAIQPWAVLPFMARHRECPKPRTLSGGQEDEVGQLTADLRAAFGVYEHEHPFFVFRLFRAAKPTVRAARRPWKAFTSVRADVATEDD